MDVRDGVREAFEKRYPVPWGIEWNDMDERYWPTKYPASDAFIAERHNAMLDAWRTATVEQFRDSWTRAYEDGYRAGFRAASGEVEQ